MSLLNHPSTEQKTQLRFEAMEQELKRLRKSSLKQSAKVSNLRLSLYFQLAFFSILIIILSLKGFIDLPQNHQSSQIMTEQIIDTVYIAKEPVKDSLYNIVYNTHKAALPKDGYNGVLFAIQIGAYKDLDLSEYKDNLLGLKQDTYDSINQFTLGEFIKYEEAQKFLNIMQQMGFSQAHIMAFKNGYRIRMDHALAIKQKAINTNEEADRGFIEANDERYAILAQ